MSYDEYLDLYLKAQKNTDALYYVVSFDVVDSKLMPVEERTALQYNIDSIMKYVYCKILEKEIELKRQILIKDNRFVRPWIQHDSNVHCVFCDPYILGDNFQFTVLRDTMTKEDIIELVNECEKKLNIKVDFHIADGYYETNEYGEGNTKFYRGYCLETLGTLHKLDIKKKINRLKKVKNL